MVCFPLRSGAARPRPNLCREKPLKFRTKRPALLSIEQNEGPVGDYVKLEQLEQALAPVVEKSMKEVDGEGPANLQKKCVKIKLIGRGAGGSVYLGLYLPTLALVAIKEVSVQNMHKLQDKARAKRGDGIVSPQESTQAAMRELHALHKNLVPVSRTGEAAWLFNYHKSIGDVHPCTQIVSFYGSYAEREGLRLELVMEFMSLGSLQVGNRPQFWLH
jgi:hypothetical protein